MSMKQKKLFDNFHYFLSIILTYVLGAQKSRLNETALLSAHNKKFCLEIKKLFMPEYDKTAIIIIPGQLINNVNFRQYIRRYTSAKIKKWNMVIP